MKGERVLPCGKVNLPGLREIEANIQTNIRCRKKNTKNTKYKIGKSPAVWGKVNLLALNTER